VVSDAVQNNQELPREISSRGSRTRFYAQPPGVLDSEYGNELRVCATIAFKSSSEGIPGRYPHPSANENRGVSYPSVRDYPGSWYYFLLRTQL